jgi:hypothetical protein
MSGFDSISQEVKDKLVSKKFDRVQRLPPIEDTDAWKEVRAICSLEQAEVYEILNAIRPSPIKQGKWFHS